MVRLGTASPWLWGLLAAVDLSSSLVRAEGDASIVPGAFIIEYEDNVVS